LTETRLDAADLVAAHPTDPVAAPQLTAFAVEYIRYGGDAKRKHNELLEYPAKDFETPAS
jgi:hypothetical protein